MNRFDEWSPARDDRAAGAARPGPGKRTRTARLRRSAAAPGAVPEAAGDAAHLDDPAGPDHLDDPAGVDHGGGPAAGPSDDPYGLHLLDRGGAVDDAGGAAVQRTGAGADLDDADTRAVAAHGVAGSGGSLPYLDTIQRSFGPAHDVSGVDAHVGGAAGDAAARIGADAYATGSSVAFRDAPDLFTAAHEAAHVIQQRAGVQLRGGVGADGDPYEQHADAVAERVVRGEPAADLLAARPGGGDGGGGGGGGGPAVQRSGVRARARAEIARIIADLDAQGGRGHRVASDGADGLYTKHTGLSNEALLDNWQGKGRYTAYKAIVEAKRTPKQREFIRKWESGDISHKPTMTGCNMFTGHFANKLGLGGDLGVFDLATSHGGTFVPARVGRYPKEGDIVKLKEIPMGTSRRLHVCISASAPTAEGDAWTVLEAGQGKPPHRDWFHYTTKPYVTSDLEGWIDIDQEVDEPVRRLLAGTWTVEYGGESYDYTFTTSGNVVRWEAQTSSAAGQGSWELAGGKVVFHWQSGSPETWPVADVRKGKGANFDKYASNPMAVRSYLLNKKFKVTAGADRWTYTFSGTNRVRWVDDRHPENTGGGTWMGSPDHLALRWDGGTFETWNLVRNMKEFTGTIATPGQATRACRVHPTW